MNLIYDAITQHINYHDHIKLDHYMQLVAEYYYNNLKGFGKEGDFITAPQISKIFGMTLGKWLINTHTKFNSPQEFIIVELGSGSGKMLNDILTFLGTEFLNKYNISIHIVEKSTSLKNLQSEALKLFTNLTITWHDQISTLPKLPTFIIANEFFDALPIKQYLKLQDNWFEVIIKLNKDTKEFYLTEGDLDPILNQQLKLKYPLAQSNSIIEESLASKEYLTSLCLHLKQNNGAMLIIDYGYEYSPLSRLFFNSTLQAIKKHKFCNVFEDIGNADITAHVDFHELTSIAKLAKCQVNQSITQNKFLFKTGIANIAHQYLKELSLEEQYKFNYSLNRLLSQEQMGSIFRVLEIYSNDIEHH